MAAKTISIDLIIADGANQLRAGLDENTVEEYQALVSSNGRVWPFDRPLTCFSGNSKDFYLADGFHRYEACRREGRASVSVEIFQGNNSDAFDYAIHCNQKHGLRLTRADRREMVRKVILNDRYKDKSLREIAELCGVSHPTVASVKEELSTEREVIDISEEEAVDPDDQYDVDIDDDDLDDDDGWDDEDPEEDEEEDDTDPSGHGLDGTVEEDGFSDKEAKDLRAGLNKAVRQCSRLGIAETPESKAFFEQWESKLKEVGAW